jgi:hypothetical protein
VRVGKVINKYKMAKHFTLDIADSSFTFEIDQQNVAAEAALDGLYVVRGSVSRETMAADQLVRSYKLLSNVEHAFRCLKSVDLMVRPIRHRLENRVRAHIFLCMLAYYVQWHMMEAWRPLLFADEDQDGKSTRDPIAAAERSEAAMQKVHSKRLEDSGVVGQLRHLIGRPVDEKPFQAPFHEEPAVVGWQEIAERKDAAGLRPSPHLFQKHRGLSIWQVVEQTTGPNDGIPTGWNKSEHVGMEKRNLSERLNACLGVFESVGIHIDTVEHQTVRVRHSFQSLHHIATGAAGQVENGSRRTVASHSGYQTVEEHCSTADRATGMLVLVALVPQPSGTWRVSLVGQNPVDHLKIAGIAERLGARVPAKGARLQCGTTEVKAKVHEFLTVGGNLASEGFDQIEPSVILGHERRERVVFNLRMQCAELVDRVLGGLIGVHSLPLNVRHHRVAGVKLPPPFRWPPALRGMTGFGCEIIDGLDGPFLA